LVLFREAFAQFNARYDRLNEELNRIRDPSAKEPLSVKDRDKDRDILFNYFNLGGEEYLYYSRGYILPEVWHAWYNGMIIFYKHPRIRALWEPELETGSYYGLHFAPGDVTAALGDASAPVCCAPEKIKAPAEL